MESKKRKLGEEPRQRPRLSEVDKHRLAKELASYSHHMNYDIARSYVDNVELDAERCEWTVPGSSYLSLYVKCHAMVLQTAMAQMTKPELLDQLRMQMLTANSLAQLFTSNELLASIRALTKEVRRMNPLKIVPPR